MPDAYRYQDTHNFKFFHHKSGRVYMIDFITESGALKIFVFAQGFIGFPRLVELCRIYLRTQIFARFYQARHLSSFSSEQKCTLHII